METDAGRNAVSGFCCLVENFDKGAFAIPAFTRTVYGHIIAYSSSWDWCTLLRQPLQRTDQRMDPAGTIASRKIVQRLLYAYLRKGLPS